MCTIVWELRQCAPNAVPWSVFLVQLPEYCGFRVIDEYLMNPSTDIDEVVPKPPFFIFERFWELVTLLQLHEGTINDIRNWGLGSLLKRSTCAIQNLALLLCIHCAKETSSVNKEPRWQVWDSGRQELAREWLNHTEKRNSVYGKTIEELNRGHDNVFFCNHGRWSKPRSFYWSSYAVRVQLIRAKAKEFSCLFPVGERGWWSQCVTSTTQGI